MNKIPNLGSGIGYRDFWFRDLMNTTEDAPDFLEVTADHFMDAPRWKMRELDALMEKFPIIPHGLDLSLGSADGLDEVYLEKLADLINKINPPYWSEHLAFTKAGGRELGHLAPLPFSSEAIEVLAKNVERTKQFTDLPLILENITYGMEMPGGEMEEGTFIKEALEASGCGWLLDVTNLYVNSVNHSHDPDDFMNSAPMEKVVQLHYVGFSVGKNGYLIDNHGTDVNPEVRNLLERVLDRSSAKGAILERDENLPPFSKIAEEISLTRKAGKAAGRWD
jgi:uncharacterized protein (UPF0276 family)